MCSWQITSWVHKLYLYIDSGVPLYHFKKKSQYSTVQRFYTFTMSVSVACKDKYHTYVICAGIARSLVVVAHPCKWPIVNIAISTATEELHAYPQQILSPYRSTDSTSFLSATYPLLHIIDMSARDSYSVLTRTLVYVYVKSRLQTCSVGFSISCIYFRPFLLQNGQ